MRVIMTGDLSPLPSTDHIRLAKTESTVCAWPCACPVPEEESLTCLCSNQILAYPVTTRLGAELLCLSSSWQMLSWLPLSKTNASTLQALASAQQCLPVSWNDVPVCLPVGRWQPVVCYPPSGFMFPSESWPFLKEMSSPVCSNECNSWTWVPACSTTDVC